MAAVVNATITEIVKAEIASASGNYFGATFGSQLLHLRPLGLQAQPAVTLAGS